MAPSRSGPEVWTSIAFADQCVASAFGPRFPSSAYALDGQLATLRTTDMDDEGNINLSTMPRASIRPETLSAHLLEPGDLLISRSGTCGIAAVFPGHNSAVVPGAFLIRFRLRDPESAQFYRRYFNSSVGRPKLDRLAVGGVQKNLTGTGILALLVPLPPRAERHQISIVIDTVDNALRKTEQLIAKLKQVKQGLLHDLLTRGVDDNGELRDPKRHPEQFKDSPLGRIPLGWDVVPIEAMLARIIDYRGRTPTKTESGVPLLTAKNVRDGHIDPEPREYIAASSYETWMTRGIPTPGDVLFTTEAPLGNVAPLPAGKIALAQRVLTLVPNRNILDPSFLLSTLLLPASKQRIKRFSTGSTVLGVKQSAFRRIVFSFAPLHEQCRISAILQAVQLRLVSEQAVFEKLRLQQQGLTEDLLTGRVRVSGTGAI